MDAIKARQAVEAARFAIRRLYLGDNAGDELAAASTPVPEEYRELSGHLHTAYSFLLDDVPAWEEQVIGFHDDGAVRLRDYPELCRPALRRD